MTVATMPFGDITLEEVRRLREREAQETSILEFKGEIPFKQEKGQGQPTTDRWYTKQDGIVPFGRDKLMAELCAFANADGGTLILGLKERAGPPAIADELAPLPQCRDLARRLADMCSDSIDPPLPYVLSKGLQVADDASGIVVIRVSRSPVGPHRVKSDGQFYIRRNDRCVQMTVREIKEVVMSLARRSETVFKQIERQRIRSAEHFNIQCNHVTHAPNLDVFQISCFAVPLGDLRIANIVSRKDIWWRSDRFVCYCDGRERLITWPLDTFGDQPRIGVRRLYSSLTDREVHEDGSVYARCYLTRNHLNGAVAVEPKTVVGLVAAMIGQIQRIRGAVGADGGEYALDVELRCSKPMFFSNEAGSAGMDTGMFQLCLPLYEVGTQETFDGLLKDVMTDIWSSVGRLYEDRCSLNWAKFLPGLAD